MPNQSPPFSKKHSGDPRSISELIDVALRGEDADAWDAIAALQWRGSEEVLGEALLLCRAELPRHRARGADILGQLGVPERTFPEQCFEVLVALLSDENHGVVASAVMALQHLDRDRALPHILPFRDHEEDEVRLGVAIALGGVEQDEAIEALIALMGDRDSEVRDWATFGLGKQSEADSPKIRTALAARLDDADSNVRYEAVCGLGLRSDRRAVPFLKTMLHDDPNDIFTKEAAAILLGLPSDQEYPAADLLGALQRRQRWDRSG